MKKLFAFIALILTITIGRVSAQDSEISIYAQGGFGFHTVGYGSGGIKPKSILRPHLGILAEKMLQDNLGIQVGLRLAGKGYMTEDRQTEDVYFKYQVKTFYLEIPVNVVYKTEQFYFGAGPYIALGMGGNYTWKGTEVGFGTIEEVDEKEKLSFGGDEVNDDFKSTDFGLNILAGYQINETMSLSLNYGLGLSDFGHYETAIKNRGFSISFNYRLK
jgi:opacity protein-like surface antigen